MDGVRVDEIAQRSGVNKRMIYHYFGDKDGLYLAALEASYAAIRTAELNLRLSDLDPIDGIRTRWYGSLGTNSSHIRNC